MNYYSLKNIFGVARDRDSSEHEHAKTYTVGFEVSEVKRIARPSPKILCYFFKVKLNVEPSSGVDLT
jgi:hypothetical protein